LLALLGVALAANHRQEAPAADWSCEEEKHAGDDFKAWAAGRWHTGWSTGEVSRNVRKAWGKKHMIGATYKTHDGITISGVSSYKATVITKHFNHHATAFYKEFNIAAANQVSAARVSQLVAAAGKCGADAHFDLWEYAGEETDLAARGETLNCHRVFGWVNCHGAHKFSVGIYYGSATAVRIDNMFTMHQGYDFLSRLIVHGFYRTVGEKCEALGGLEEETSTTSTGKEVRHEWTEKTVVPAEDEEHVAHDTEEVV
jgi:hypothetical protein